MKQDDIRKYLNEMEMYDTIMFENPSYETAIIGISDDDRLIYDYDKMVEFLKKTDNMNDEEACEFIDYNTLRAIPYMGGRAPIVNMKLNFLD